MAQVIVSMSNQYSSDYLLHVATLGKTIGLRGELKLHIKTDFPEQFKAGSKFFISKNQQLTIESINNEREIVKFIGIDSPEDAKKLTNKELMTTIEQTKRECQLEEGQFFWFDLIGCEIIENNQKLGKVAEIERIGAVDYFSVKTSQELVEKGSVKSFLIPYQPIFVKSVDIALKLIVVEGGKDILEAS